MGIKSRIRTRGQAAIEMALIMVFFFFLFYTVAAFFYVFSVTPIYAQQGARMAILRSFFSRDPRPNGADSPARSPAYLGLHPRSQYFAPEPEMQLSSYGKTAEVKLAPLVATHKVSALHFVRYGVTYGISYYINPFLLSDYDASSSLARTYAHQSDARYGGKQPLLILDNYRAKFQELATHENVMADMIRREKTLRY